nr:unnamed protein product [Digitaria exilis]
MEFQAALMKVIDLICEALRNVEMLPAALVTSGVVEAAAALALAIFMPPGGIFQHHDKAAFYLYYGILFTTLIFGLLEASVGFWVSRDLNNRGAVGKTVMFISILPIVLVAGLGGFVVLK